MSSSVDTSNWLEPEKNIWGFQNVDKIVATQPIARGAQTSQLEPALSSKVVDGFNLELDNKSTLNLDQFLSWSETDGFIVLQNGRIIHEQYERTNSANSKHIIMSMSKSICGLLAGILAKQGKLDVNAAVTSYVPEAKGSAFEQATVQQCLDMRSNIHYADDSADYRAAAGWNPPADNATDVNLFNFLTALQAPQPPAVEGSDGAPFTYASVNTDFMGILLERAAGGGKKYAELLSELLWAPMGAESDGLMTVDGAGNARAAGGVCATLRDVARIGQMLVEEGRGIVPAEWIEDMLHGGSKEAFAPGAWAPIFTNVFNSVAYRSYWVVDEQTEVLMATGIFGQHLYVDRKNGIVMAKTGSQAVAIDGPKLRANAQAFREVQRILVD